MILVNVTITLIEASRCEDDRSIPGQTVHIFPRPGAEHVTTVFWLEGRTSDLQRSDPRRGEIVVTHVIIHTDDDDVFSGSLTPYHEKPRNLEEGGVQFDTLHDYGGREYLESKPGYLVARARMWDEG
jgi:hypothetical protein